MTCLDLLWAVPGFFLETFLHESAHGLAAKCFKASILSFKPWPHRAEGRLYFGRVTWTPRVRGRRGAAVAMAPYALALVTGPSLAAAGLALDAAPLLVLGGCVGWDFVRGMLQPLWRRDRGDLNSAIRELRLNV